VAVHKQDWLETTFEEHRPQLRRLVHLTNATT
jgi:hypothetical protein